MAYRVAHTFFFQGTLIFLENRRGTGGIKTRYNRALIFPSVKDFNE